MANAFRNYTARNIGTSAADVLSAVAASTTLVCIGMTLANTTGASVNVTVRLNDGANDTTIVKDAPIPPGGSLVILGGDQKVVLETGDKLTVQSDTATSVDAILSVLELT